MNVSDRACLVDDLRLPSRTLPGRTIERVRPLDRQRPRSRPPQWIRSMIGKRMSDNARLPPGGGRRQTNESVSMPGVVWRRTTKTWSDWSRGVPACMSEATYPDRHGCENIGPARRALAWRENRAEEQPHRQQGSQEYRLAITRPSDCQRDAARPQTSELRN
jgi:hypothetical protein